MRLFLTVFAVWTAVMASPAAFADGPPVRDSYCVSAGCASRIDAHVVDTIDPGTGFPVPVSSASPLPVVGTPASATGGAAAASATTSGAYQVVFAAGSITRGCSVQNPTGNAVSLWVDFAGATGSTRAATSLEVVPGASIRCDFVPTGAVTVFSTNPITFNALRW
ncbi:putative exported protein [Granulibacter bethesdensis]|uniref:Exported protein n=1 Tax=Granulibacter bethesdensis TaxID=364410 RepID=A0AAN0REA1_9PROT|nr:hypothetical protein [Granulibacter bethesdensis]AHJ63273.1 putative exported protein [Granulibacter bethesdensis]